MFSEPNKNIEQAGIQAGDYVADLGSGSGFYTLSAAKVVGERGKVFAIDIQKDLLTKTKNDLAKEGVFNVDILWGDIEKLGGTRLNDSSVDWVILSNILFQVREREIVAKETARILKSGGRVLVVDWSDSFGGLGPRQEDVVSPDNAKNLFLKLGLVVDKEINAGAHHYGIVMKKS
ncbi:MAG: hypothetical protein COV95_01125 [Candidatus Zambryskibacteria bacterium CG11_big_fil_rev_8_21_14_0_20_40_24]|uniref:Methyltransferase domain-containing protein n=1 Tax=Candidatus Zambryskibacteria bacterium CG11_big_fil_rev_8_21_14_0_20_40_24 TaxID=1975116 RepID=A0A2H0K6Z0_9BACT|nr:MAG: hypothetical protein COV95_01125 [Candidatus Zambryskibacteria bacterium CG11_big_fil_rev_8_21_14_0_20_40_24]